MSDPTRSVPDYVAAAQAGEREAEGHAALVEAVTPLVGLTQCLHGWLAQLRNRGNFGPDTSEIGKEAGEWIGELEESHHALTAALRPFAAARPEAPAPEGAASLEATESCHHPTMAPEGSLLRCADCGHLQRPKAEREENDDA